MQPIVLPKARKFFLTPAENARLLNIAPLFGLRFTQLGGDLFAIRDLSTGEDVISLLPSDTAHWRLLSEICSRSAKWLHFHFGQNCRDTLLQNSDARLGRIAELYARDVITAPVDTGDISRICIQPQ